MAKIRTVVELEELRNRLREAEETLSAIRNGEVDSLIVSGPHGDQVFSLKGAEQPYRIFVEQMQEGALTLTREGTILYANQRFAHMTKTRLEKVIGSQIQSFVHPTDQNDLTNILAKGAAGKARYVLSAEDGSLIPAQLNFHPLPIDEIDAISLVVTDLTEQEEKRGLTETLSNLRSAQEQLQRQNDELKASRAAAEAASNAKDQFLAALSHELRTPLTPVLMIVTALEADRTLPDRARNDLSLVRRNVELEARLIDDLLDLTRIVHGKLALHAERLDLHAVVHAAIETASGDIQAKQLQVVRELQAENHYVLGDTIRLQQVLWNLIRNSAKFTPPRGRITVRSRNSPDGMLHVSIMDTGIGIDANTIGKIFAPFQQADFAVKRQFGGLGLGLTISRRLAEMHGGTIEAQSDGIDKGATFTLSLPVARATAATTHTGNETAADPATSTEKHRKRLQILLVEDHDDTRHSLVRLLSRQHDVRDTNSVDSALKIAAQHMFDLVISDLGLPDGSGLDLMHRLRDQYGLQGICLTGYGMEDDIARSADAGFRRHLTKPVDVEKLQSTIDELSKSSGLSPR